MSAGAAALTLTLLFVPDEPRAPVVALEIVETSEGRTLDVVVAPAPAADGAAIPPLTAHRRSPPVDGSTRLRSLPVAPEGAAVADVVDGVLVTVDDLGRWVPAAAPAVVAAPKKGGAPVPGPPSSLPQPPALPVASAQALRVFVPTIVEGRSAPASLHGVGADGAPQTFAGHAIVVARPRNVLALTVADVDQGNAAAHVFDASVPVLTGNLADRCTEASTRVGAEPLALQRGTHLQLDGVACVGGLVVGTGHGTRLGERPEQDRPARGGVLVRR
jgi:hypothetical protein